MSASFPSFNSQPGAFPLPTISEDTLHYAIHLPLHLEPSSTALLITEHVNSLLPTPWLWNKDGWELKIAAESSQRVRRGVGGKLEGTMRVGDAVDDEWLVVWLLREVSRKWPEVVISVRDTDGEFLLIEAADHLPPWVSPENAENRLWLAGGHLHLLPLSIRSSGSSARRIPDDEEMERDYDPEAYLAEEDALRAVRTERYRASESVEEAVWDRVSHYPSKLTEHLHRTNVYLPTPVARALSQHPELIQRAVEGFYIRDPAQLRAAAKMTHFPPFPSILTSVLMTRPAYAQLRGQVFHPPRVFGPEWHPRESASGGEEGRARVEKERIWRDLGVKIATGFEIMYKEGGRRGRGGTASDASVEDLKGDQDFQAYLGSLKAAGWFKGEVEGSQVWKEREAAAVKGWRSIRSKDTASTRPSFAYETNSALESSKQINSRSLTVSDTTAEDSDSWLQVSPNELDDILSKASGQASNAPASQSRREDDSSEAVVSSKDQALGPGEQLRDMAKKIEAFVGGEGDLQGARFADELSDEDMDDDNKDDVADEEADEVAEDEWRGMSAARKQDIMANLVAPLDKNDWGQKEEDQADDDVVMVGSSSSKPTSARAVKPKTPTITVTNPANAGMRPPRFSKQEYDGVIDESDSDEEEDELPPPGTLGRKIAEMRWADTGPRIEEINDDDKDEDQLDQKRNKAVKWDESIDQAMRRKVEASQNGPETGEDAPQIINAQEPDEGDVDMAAEQEEFLRFARDALGVNEEMWDEILKDRQVKEDSVTKTTGTRSTKVLADMYKIPPFEGSMPNVGTQPNKAKAAAPLAQSPKEGEVNMDLDSFDKVLDAMDAELAKKKGQTSSASSAPTSQSKSNTMPNISSKHKAKYDPTQPLPPLPTEADLEAMDDEDLMAVDRELRAALKSAGIDDEDEEEEEIQEGTEEEQGQYRMMRDFLESYRSQQGQSGVVGNLFGRLGGGSKP